MSVKSEYILCVQLPNQPQTMLGYPDEASAVEAAKLGIESGIINSKAEVGHVMVHTVPGTVYIILSKALFERQAMQQQLMQRGQGR